MLFHKCIIRSCSIVSESSLRLNARRLSTLDEILRIRNISTITPAVEKELELYSKKKQTSVSLRSLMDTGRGENSHIPTPNACTTSDKVLMQVACFLHRELPIRLAHRATRLEASPLFSMSANIRNVSSWYKTSFAQLRACPVPQNMESEAMFAKVIESIYERHGSTLITMAKGAHELRNLLKKDVTAFADFNDIQARLDEFYMSRIGIRMLIGQYLALRQPISDPDVVGLIHAKSSPYHIAQEAIDNATYVCRRTHGDAPEVIIHGRTDLTFPYVPSHLNYMLLELLKNSMRATVETHGTDDMPPIKIVIADGEENEDVVIKVSDEGGGISRSNMERIWSYLYTTANPRVLESMLNNDDGEIKDFDTSTPLAGLGCGLPIARNYARSFNGELTIMSMEGYGTDSFIYLPRLNSKDEQKV